MLEPQWGKEATRGVDEAVVATGEWLVIHRGTTKNHGAGFSPVEVELGNLQPTTHHRVPIRAWKVRVPQRNLTNEWSGDSRLGRGALHTEI